MSATFEPGHPRQVAPLQALEAPSRAFGEALVRGRMHHGWLLCGPEGSGKASFAYQAARRLLGAAPDPAAGPLASPASDPVSRMIAAQSHPDLMVLELDGGGEGGVARKTIPVDEARRLPDFFSKSPAIAPCRVAIIDAADDLNPNAANAVLKTLEEPSGRGVVFLVSHAPGRLLPTIRSRCRRLMFAPWPADSLATFLVDRSGIDAQDASRLAVLARGAPGQALRLAAAGALELDRQAGALLGALPEVNRAELMAIADGFRGGEGARRFGLFVDRLGHHIRDRATEAVSQGALDAAQRWAGTWERASALAGQVEGLNLDRADALWSLVAELRAAAGAGTRTAA